MELLQALNFGRQLVESPLAGGIVLLLLVGAALVIKHHGKSIDDLNKRADEQRRWNTHIETRMDGMGSTLPELRKDVQAVHQRMDDSIKVTSEMKGALDGLAKTTGLINQHLLDQSGKRGGEGQ